MTTDASQRFIERVEQARDLRSQIGELAQDEAQELQFYEWSPGRTLATVWNTETGEEVTLPRYQAVSAVNSPNSTGTGFMWTAHKDRAPKQRVNTVKCFLHPESAYRASLNEMGIVTVCMSEHFASEGAMWGQARSKHPSAFKAYEEAIARQEREEDRAEQRKQTAAMLDLVGQPSAKRPKATE